MKKNEIIKDRLEEWVESKGFLNSRFTIIELCKIIGINRTYLSNYINNTYGLNFNLWINHLRIEEAKQLMGQTPKRSLSEIAICNNTQQNGRKSVKITIFVRLR